ncbi:50S ribosomal protein L34 [Sutterella faecalis]|uniref:50S ribosomal protein L34 n=2 Tax=Sutterella TaxID=40544 RepID=A0AAI9WND8_9BURK|nr:50S ribosomal protein L34 [Sutterella seckii]QDA55722.1 50S ribosomal protein L34 [Sutterella faecalis]
MRKRTARKRSASRRSSRNGRLPVKRRQAKGRSKILPLLPLTQV